MDSAADGLYIAMDATSGYPLEMGDLTSSKFRGLQRLEPEAPVILTATPFFVDAYGTTDPMIELYP